MLETSRLFLACPAMDHEPILRQLWRDEQVRRYLGGPVSETIIDGKIAGLHRHWERHGFGEWVVCEKETGQITGLCGLDRSEEGIEISYMFFPAFWGRGLSAEAVRASLDHGFRTLTFERILAITQQVNLASCRMLEHIGMRHTHTFARWEAPQHCYELTRAEWLAKNAERLKG